MDPTRIKRAPSCYKAEGEGPGTSATFSKSLKKIADNSTETATTTQSYKWTDEDTRELIPWRAANADLFTGKRNATFTGFEEFIKKMGLERRLDSKAIRKRWENLVQKYKALKHPRTGVNNTEGGEATAASWKWYALMDAAIGSRPFVEPPVLFASSNPEVARASPPPVVTPDKGASSNVSTPKRRRVDTMEILNYLKDNEWQYDEAMQEMEREYQKREETREAAEREERWHREAVERKERFFREMIQREERREREAAAREERLLAILDKFTNKL